MDFQELVELVQKETKDWSASEIREFVSSVIHPTMTTDEIITYGVIANLLSEVPQEARARYFQSLDALRASMFGKSADDDN